MFGYETLWPQLEEEGLSAWSDTLQASVSEALDPASHGNLPTWLDAYRSLPELEAQDVHLGDALTVSGPITDEQRTTLKEAMRQFHPWRKGPFRFFDVFIDTEWRSDWKWNRLAPGIDLHGRSVLDVGCGNGYYGWRMLDAGARQVVGLDPYLLYVMQYAALRKYLGDLPNYVLPGSDALLPKNLAAFDVVFSMGVLYHRTSPIDHLLSLAHALKPGGELLLETLILPAGHGDILLPPGRYAKMRNVWFLPSLELLQTMLRRTGFADSQVLDITTTTTEEQRRTDWMTFESLADFLDPRDSTRTLEGHPAPTRALVWGRKR